jgi:NAD(P)-dependent dehydrogenase (short-subunit alcohol dehydrogenase family)
MNLQLFNLEDRVAIVTGAGKGIGNAMAVGLADAGANVVVAARTKSEIEQVASQIEQKGTRALAVPTDVNIQDQINSLVEKTVKKFGKIDILVNNAGGTTEIPAMEMSQADWDANMNLNLRSAFLCSQAAGKVMISRTKGSIVNLSSMHGLRANSANAAYGAAKAGIINLTMTMAIALAQYNVRVNAIAPGYVITRPVFHSYAANPEVVRQIPLRRLANPEDIVGAVIYLASDASLYVTGATIVVDGGLTIKPTVAFS